MLTLLLSVYFPLHPSTLMGYWRVVLQKSLIPAQWINRSTESSSHWHTQSLTQSWGTRPRISSDVCLIPESGFSLMSLNAAAHFTLRFVLGRKQQEELKAAKGLLLKRAFWHKNYRLKQESDDPQASLQRSSRSVRKG